MYNDGLSGRWSCLDPGVYHFCISCPGFDAGSPMIQPFYSAIILYIQTHQGLQDPRYMMDNDLQHQAINA